MPVHEIHDHDRGLAFDLVTLSRRRALAVLGAGAVGLVVALDLRGGRVGECATIPEEVFSDDSGASQLGTTSGSADAG